MHGLVYRGRIEYRPFTCRIDITENFSGPEDAAQAYYTLNLHRTVSVQAPGPDAECWSVIRI
jgi:hypothetical protein